ncbi:putative ribonucleotide-diphosphate reductase alpha subunit [Candidatus Carsonella ruddii HT isolate Thao2000]|uniref:Putative ribonucleotide-diphosphate reductase alpha subunit n=1 Tax=Candidatus Carsonella ruddii HT isolate Thao2000 TaxID=1202539 RepID=J3VQ51_CARRU|nr:ribonucleotide-diphosphate reductase subunit alpha [Candidatus Carsonella ruddii]AFP84061.1 putative ribonucleotide-diphosphate reductase alpha subunit [Candidatus Carsonella ruddii HT isolate Thao2000]
MIEKILLLKIYSFSNYKTNILTIKFKKLKKKYNIINKIYYILNNLIFLNKKKLSYLIYNYITKLYNKLNFNKLYIFSKKFPYLIEFNENYSYYELCFFIKETKIKKYISIKNIKKIYTNILKKKNNFIHETLKERYIISFLYIFINFENKIKKILNFFTNYFDENIFFFLKNIKKVCSILYFNYEEYSNKLHIGMMKNQNNNFPYYILFIINNLIKKNFFKINISVEIYNLDILKIVKNSKLFKKVKINLIINIPDLFIENIIKSKKWYLFDSLKIKKKYNYYLQNFYDEYIGYGNFRNLYKKIIKNKLIFKVEIKSKKLLLFLIKYKINFVFSDINNRKNLNKHNGSLINNFYHNKIFDRNNYFKKNMFYLKNANLLIKRNNSYYLEIKLNQFFLNCKNNIKNFFKKIIFLNFKNDFLIIEREIHFHLNFRLKPISIVINQINKKNNNYLNYYLCKMNSFLSSKSEPYCCYPGSDYFNYHYYYRNKFISKKWFFLINYIDTHRMKFSLFLIKNNKKKINITFDKYYLKLLIIKWQFNETYKF